MLAAANIAEKCASWLYRFQLHVCAESAGSKAKLKFSYSTSFCSLHTLQTLDLHEQNSESHLFDARCCGRRAGFTMLCGCTQCALSGIACRLCREVYTNFTHLHVYQYSSTSINRADNAAVDGEFSTVDSRTLFSRVEQRHDVCSEGASSAVLPGHHKVPSKT